MSKENFDGGWLLGLIESFRPDDPTPTGAPEEMTKRASRRAFEISTAAAIPPGPAGLITIIPELAAVTKVQVNLIHRIAAYYDKTTVLRENPRMILLILGNALGLSAGKSLVAQYGERIVFRAIESETLKKITKRLGLEIVENISARLSGKAIARWVPVVLAPIFGLISKKMTKQIGVEAMKIFKRDIIIEVSRG